MKFFTFKQHQWAEVWKEFDERFDSCDFQPRDKVQRRWLQEIIARKMREDRLIRAAPESMTPKLVKP